MTNEEKQKIHDICSRLNTVARTLTSHEPENFTQEDLDDLSGIILNIAKVLEEMAEE